MRKNRGRKEFPVDWLSEGVEAHPRLPPEQRRRLDESIQQREIERALAGLTTKQRQAFVLRHFEELPLSEIARAMACREGSVKSHLNRAIRKLRKSLSSSIDMEEGI